MAKRIQVSDDNGVTKYTLPGNTGEISSEAGELDDTIFGQEFQSSQTGLIGWTISANALFKGFAGYLATIMKAGSSTSLTDEAMSLVTGKTYKVTNAAKNVLDRAVAIVFEDNGTPVDAEDIASIDYLFGRVTFASGYTPTGPITIASGSYFPLTVLGCSNEFTLTQTANAIDNTCMSTAQTNDGHRTFEYGLKTVSLELTGIYKAANAFLALLEARSELIIEINPDGNDKSVARGFFKPMSHGQSGDVGDLEEETISFNLSVPDDSNIPYPFQWIHASDTTLSTAVRKCLDAWQNKTMLDVYYLYDGTNGATGEAMITDISLSGGLEAMNEFTVDFQGSGDLTAYP